MFIDNIIKDKKILVFVGSGGVGKTSISASVSLYAASLGKKVLILTIDPSKRLANTLKIDINNPNIVKIDLSSIKKENIKGELHALVLDMKSTIDKMVENNISKENQKQLFKNKAYKSFSTDLAGVYEFAAMDVLWEVYSSNEYDIIILDTPPTSNALDFFTYPERILDTIDNKIAKILILVYKKTKKFNFSFINIPTQILLRTINKFTGIEMLETLSAFLYYFSDLLDIVKIKSKEVNILLKSLDVSYFVVSSPNYSCINEAKFFRDELIKKSFNFEAFIINKSYFRFKNNYLDKDKTNIVNKISSMKEFENDKYNVEKLFSKLFLNLKQLSKLSEKEDDNLKDISDKIIKIPLFKDEIYDLNSLFKVISYLKNS